MKIITVVIGGGIDQRKHQSNLQQKRRLEFALSGEYPVRGVNRLGKMARVLRKRIIHTCNRQSFDDRINSTIITTIRRDLLT